MEGWTGGGLDSQAKMVLPCPRTRPMPSGRIQGIIFHCSAGLRRGGKESLSSPRPSTSYTLGDFLLRMPDDASPIPFPTPPPPSLPLPSIWTPSPSIHPPLSRLAHERTPPPHPPPHLPPRRRTPSSSSACLPLLLTRTSRRHTARSPSSSIPTRTLTPPRMSKLTLLRSHRRIRSSSTPRSARGARPPPQTLKRADPTSAARRHGGSQG